MLNEFLADGYRRSPSFRRLVDGIAATRTLVYVEAGVCAFGHAMACVLPVVAAGDGVRYVRIVLTRPVNFRRPNLLVALIGHELQHAFELAERPEVVDIDAMYGLYRRIGFRANVPGYETAAALGAGKAVLDELESPLTHVRSAEARVRKRIALGYARSAAFKTLVDTVERLPCLVDVSTTVKLSEGMRASRFHGATGSPEMPVLHLLILASLSADETIAVIGHELQHISEGMTGGTLGDSASITTRFAELDPALGAGAHNHETEAAVAVTAAIAAELRRTR